MYNLHKQTFTKKTKYLTKMSAAMKNIHNITKCDHNTRISFRLSIKFNTQHALHSKDIPI